MAIVWLGQVFFSGPSCFKNDIVTLMVLYHLQNFKTSKLGYYSHLSHFKHAFEILICYPVNLLSQVEGKYFDIVRSIFFKQNVLK